MSLELSMWLFGACGAAILGVLTFAWICHEQASRKIADANSRSDKIKEDFYSYKVHVAEHFSTVASTILMEKRMVDSLEEIKESLKRQDDKLDRIARRE